MGKPKKGRLSDTSSKPTNSVWAKLVRWEPLSISDVIKLLTVAFGLLSGVFVAGANLGQYFNIVASKGVKAAESTGAIGVIAPEQITKKVYYGYYLDVQNDNEQKLTDETLELEFVGTEQIRATVSGDVMLGSRRVPRTWKFTGFRNGTRIAMSYATIPDHQDPNPAGIGSYVLDRSNAADYSGAAIYWDCELKKMFECPYAMTTEKIPLGEARLRWPKLFEHKCVAIELTPDASPALIASNTPACGAPKSN